MSDIVSWGDKAKCLLTFVKESHNATWKSEDSLVNAGRMTGNAILMAFAVECALKALLEVEGKRITRRLQKHDLHKLFTEGQVPFSVET